MQVYYAPPRALEKQFAEYALSLRPGPGRPVLVICPSGRQAERLRRLLAEKSGFVSNVYFKNFTQLTAELDRETPGAAEPVLPPDALHDYLLKNLLLKPGLDRYAPSRGFVIALRASLRDMADALADADVLEEHLQTSSDPVLLAESAHLQWLVNVYRAYQKETDAVQGYRSYKTYFENALEAAKDSEYLRSFSQIIVYGFYELTGRQLELFNVLRAHYPLAAFWLYAEHPAFQFAKKFFETNILGSAARAQTPQEDWSAQAASDAARFLFTAQSADKTPPGLRFVCAPDPEGELFFAAKEMLRLHEEQGVAFADMALTARSLEPYKTLLPGVFEQNGIPLNAAFEFGLSSRPLGVFVSNLFSLARGGFERETVTAVVGSPYFKKKNAWRYLINESLARRDFAQWADLVRPSLKFYDPAFLPWLEEARRRLDFLEGPLPWQTLCRAAREFLEDNTDVSSFSLEEKAVWEQVQQALNGFARYVSAAPRARAGEFLDELSAALQNARLDQRFDMAAGVNVLDALSLRGLGFKTVFVLGMNEKSFPQVIREDPVLKDYYRRALRDQLGFWLNQKMERFEEERLLFFCAVSAASDNLYLSYLRADAEGKPLVPSGYLTELARAARADLNSPSVARVSGRLTERIKQTPLELLGAKELSLSLAARGATAQNYQNAGLLAPGGEDALEAARQIASSGALTARDGAVKSGADIFAAQDACGFSPSSLQDLARCPMKYFLAKGVGLREKDETLSRSDLAPDARGTAYHETLMEYYERLYKEGLAGQLFPAAMRERLGGALGAHYDEKSYKRFGIYPVIWQLLLKDIHDKLADFVVKDAQNMHGYAPAVFETLFEKIYAPSPALKMKLKGIIDRIDVDASGKTFRVIDYKSSKRGGKDLAADMFKKVILQPFIYLILAREQKQTQGLAPDGAALLSINKGYDRQDLTQEGFEAVRPKAEAFLALLAQLIKSGSFFINPGDHCEYCPYAAVCRKDSFRSLLRARHAPQSRALEEAKQQ